MNPEQNESQKTKQLTRRIMAGLLLGVITGALCHQFLSTDTAKDVASYLSILTDIFLRMIKMVIAPLVFATLVSGIASMKDTATIGRIGTRAVAWFLGASLISLVLGLLFVNLLQPGVGTGITLPDAEASTNLKTSALNFKDFVTQVFPTSIFSAMSNNAILQILVFSVFLGTALAGSKDDTAELFVRLTDKLMHLMLRITTVVMNFAPVAVFAAIASVITQQGLGILWTYGKFIGGFYVALAALWLVLIGAGSLFLGRDMRTLLQLLREPMVLAFSTASSESAYPKMVTQLERFGTKDRVVGFVLPLGYSFNLDGSMIYQAFAAMFVAQAYGHDMSIGTQLAMLLVLMISSKGIAGVPRASLVVVAAVLPMFDLPEAGLLLIMGVDQFLDMGRTVTNVLGNGIAAAVIGRWEDKRAEVDAPAPTALNTQAGFERVQ